MTMRVRNYELKKILGKGSFGVTYLGIDIKTGEKVAVKTINIRKSEEKGADRRVIDEEINTIKFLTGERVKFLAAYLDNFEDELNGEETIFIISEYIDGVSLSTVIENYAGRMPENILWPLFLQLVLGLKYIHDKGYAHQDIKPDNILVTKDNIIKYIDFGISCLEKCEKENCRNSCRMGSGSLLYMPPEFYNGKGEDSFLESKAHDIWSLGVVMYNMAMGLYEFPFEIYDQGKQLEVYQIEQEISNAPNKQTEYIFDDGRTNHLIDSLLITDWKLRPEIRNVLNNLVNNIFAIPW